MGATGGRAAMRGAEDDARRDVDAALALADGIGTRAVHVLAGRTGDPDLGQFVRVLRHAAGSTDRTILIEPLCSAAAPGYALPTLDLAIRVQDDVGAPNLRILFDYYHIETAHGGAADLFRRHRARIGHVQIASVPARTAPAAATHAFIDACRRAGWTAPFGCEYRPEGPDIRPPGRS
ncbi:hypothetical protein OCGS_1417 [Oceaniovalibus guishaninsula JLT2003]|uniref:Xylose isomerase-like TIM barrel domain-containing protein n=2 Tax=Oceaniovalibus TaxID=1207070 RepID=K2HNZ4_9RHOB|nr:hypothetical protein OCGS_1417 [Oceaniovalibus guishaninsula JLT2003]